MKNTFTLAAAAMLAATFAGCNSVPATDPTEDRLVHTTVEIAGNTDTRSTGVTSAMEDNIRNLQLFVFEESGATEFYLDAGNASTADVVSKEGPKKIVAVVNAPSLKDVKNSAELMTRTSYLSDNSLNAMVMTGEVDALLNDGGHITIPVTRIISKVMIRKITASFTGSNASKEFRIKSIYLINVAGDNTYAASSEPRIWYNKLANGQNDPSCQSVSFLSDPVDRTLTNNSSYTNDHSFYCYPNLISTESFESTWSPRHTMLVVEAQLGGAQTYYPIELPVIGRNKAIIVNELVITKKGSDYPYIPVTDGSCEVTVSVVGWDVILNYTETI